MKKQKTSISDLQDIFPELKESENVRKLRGEVLESLYNDLNKLKG